MLLAAATAVAAAAAMAAAVPCKLLVGDLRTERMTTTPAFVDTGAPRLSWTLTVPAGTTVAGATQSAYRIVAAASRELAEAVASEPPGANPSLIAWDSGVVASNATLWIPYSGGGLDAPGDAVFWTVQVTDADGVACAVPPAVGIVKAPAANTPSDWRGAAWIVRDNEVPTTDCAFYTDDPAPLLRKAFTLPADVPVRSASLFITGLGFYTATLNGAPVSLHAGGAMASEGYPLDPAWTSYGRRVLFSGFNVTALLTQADARTGAAAENVLAITLGKG
jgi:hypothetical protein